MVRGDGFYLIDSQGRKYLDGTASMWCNVWGYGQNAVIKSMQQQLRKLPHATLFGLANDTSTLLAEKLVKIAKGMGHVFYTDNGSTAIEAAMKMAVQYWRNKGRHEKHDFISLEHGYHGDTVAAMSVGYIKKFFGPYKSMLSSKVHRIPSPHLYGSEFSDVKNLTAWCLAKAEDTLRKQAGPSAALVMESGAQIAGGAIVYPEGFQREISRLCRKHDVLLILDEIATGFGRLGNMTEYLAQESTPDIACFGKALTGGYFPISAVLTTDEVFDMFLGEYSDGKQLFHGHTFTGHPVGCAAALANIDLYEKRRLISKIRSDGRHIASRLQEIAESPIVGDLRHKGMLAGIELALRGKPITKVGRERINYFIMKQSLGRGVYVRPLGNIMLVMPSLAADRASLDRIIDVQIELVREIERSVLH
jgi:adenosylmethionine-8-amino-7-oxononanoate aminotransferase